MLTFQIGLSDNFGNVVNFNLKENGEKISVNMINRQVIFFLIFLDAPGSVLIKKYRFTFKVLN